MNTKNKILAFKESTARFSNRLPHWHPMRGLPASKWRNIFGPTIADHLDEANTMLGQYRSNLFLSTSTLDVPSKLYAAPSLAPDRLDTPSNLILNSDFSETAGEDYHHWKKTDLAEYTQYLNQIVPKGAALVLRFDGTGITQVVVNGINTTNGLPFTLTATTTGVASSYSLTGLELTSIVVNGSSISAEVSLFIGSEQNEWVRNPKDNTYWLEIDRPGNHNIKGDNRRVIECLNLTDMFYRTPPTYVDFFFDLLPEDTDLITKVNFVDFKVEFHGDEYTKEYSVFNDGIRKTIDRSVTYDYTLQELSFDGLFRDTQEKIVAINIVAGMIIALSYATPLSSSSSSSSSGSEGDRQYSLLYISPDHVLPEDSKMQVIKRHKLGLIPEFANKNVFLTAKANNQYSVVFVVSDLILTSIFELPVKYDYYYEDLADDELIFREKYEVVTGISSSQLSYSPNFNHLDDHGLLRSLPRIDEEENYDYKNRLIDYSSIHLPGINEEGLQNGANIRFGLTILDSIIRIDGNVNVIKHKNIIYLSTPDNFITESLIRDDNYYQVQLNQSPASVRTVKVNDVLYPSTLYSVSADEGIIKFANYPIILAGASIEVSYIPFDNIFDTTDMSIRQVYLTLQGLGYMMFTETDLNILGTLNSSNLMDVAGLTPVEFRYYPATYKPFDLEDFAEFQDLSVSFPGFSNLQRKVIEVRNSVHDEWHEQIEGKDRWDMVITNSFGGGLLPGYHDGFFSWLKDSDGNLLHHKDAVGGPYIKQGFTLDELQSGVNATLKDLEIESDLEVKSISSTYNPQVQPGFFYIKEMQFYLFADKQVEILNDIEYTQIDLDAIRSANPTLDLTGVTGGAYKFDGDNLYVLTADVGFVNITTYNNITSATGTVSVAGYTIFQLIPVYFLSQEPKPGRPVIITDMRASPDEMQYDLKPSGLLIPFTIVSDPTQVKVEYDTTSSPELANLPIDIKRDRGFLSIYLSAAISEASLTASMSAIVNGKGKAHIRSVYDPDIVIAKDMDRDPGEVVILDKNLSLTLAAPSSPTMPNTNLYTANIGWGHNWGFDFG